MTEMPEEVREAVLRLAPPLRVEAFNHIEAGKADFMAMIVRNNENDSCSILAQQLQDGTAGDIVTILNYVAKSLRALQS